MAVETYTWHVEHSGVLLTFDSLSDAKVFVDANEIPRKSLRFRHFSYATAEDYVPLERDDNVYSWRDHYNASK